MHIVYLKASALHQAKWTCKIFSNCLWKRLHELKDEANQKEKKEDDVDMRANVTEIEREKERESLTFSSLQCIIVVSVVEKNIASSQPR